MRSREAGFSLLEAMVAVAILSGGLIASLQLQSANARRDATILARSQALLTAEALMAEIQVGLHPISTIAAGVTEFGVTWRIEVSPFDSDRPEKAGSRLSKAIVAAMPASGGRPVTLSMLIYGDPSR